ncbi:urea carboxylase-associated protein 2 [Catenovulum agarivorans DS-2]|uniref:Urea carboxylase-associated protein 2 n=1 Tax=Catenovulum agarivorans DS-2 TaxID=1328313 RepID=W7Q897_9ALTE|nr:urea amidolyase associated protein UAAP1 [Catenovulum agarivorans]EWH09054.1 urea carboxylase-associated protein 2 [Catenovulum agarivorans DS-2]
MILYKDSLPSGKHWSMKMRRGTSLRLIDKTGGANVGVLFYNPDNLLERYNAPDTLKCQHTFKLTKGHCLYSDMGRIFCAITDDSFGWHDTVCGNSNAAMVTQKWGKRDYQNHRNHWKQNGFDAFLVEGAKYGLNKQDLAANLNVFTKVEPDNEGHLRYAEQQSTAGDFIELRFEMDTLVLFHTCPHPLSSSTEYPQFEVEYQILTSAPIAEDDLCKNSCPENQRGYENNRLYHLGL